MSHDNLTKPADPPPSPNLVFVALYHEVEHLRLHLLLGNYAIAQEKDARLKGIVTSARALPETTSPEERSAKVAEFHDALDDFVRFDETMELAWNGERLVVLRAPVCVHLTAGVAREIPVTIANTANSTIAVGWQAQGTGVVEILSGGKARFFVPVLAASSNSGVAIGFDAGAFKIEMEMPLHVAPSGRLRVRVLDEQGKPAAVRLYATGSDGRAYVPDGAIHRMTDMGEHYCHVPSEFAVTLPAGEATLDFVKGFEYRVKTIKELISPGEEKSVTVQLARWADMPAEGWFSGDGHIHMHYGGTLTVLPEEAMLMLEAEDVNVGNMVVANCWGDDVFDREHFEGATNRLSLPRHVLHWSEEFRNDFLGHLILYELTELTDPIYTGFANTPHAQDFPLNADICDQTIAQGGVATGAHPFWGRAEHAIDVAVGKMMGIETAGYGAHYQSGIDVLHGLWNCGFRTVATAGTDSFLNQVKRDPLGGARCYALVEGELSYHSWVKAMEAGRTFVTTGPMLFLEVDGQIPGSEVTAKGAVRIRARASSPWPLSDLTIFYNGQMLARAKVEGETEITIDREFELPESGWIAAQCTGPHNRFIMGGSLFKAHLQVAHTTPVWIVARDAAGQAKAIPPSRDAVRLLRWTDQFTKLVEEKGTFADDEQRHHMREVYGAARGRFAEMASRHLAAVEPVLVKSWTDEKGRVVQDFVLQGEEPIPFVVMSDGAPGAKPVAFWQHGATGTRLANLDAMHHLCDAGYLTVSIDQRMHGDRGEGYRKVPIASGDEARFEDTIIYIGCGTSRDAIRVLDYVETRADAIPERVAWTGGSLGGIVGTILATRDKRIKALASLISAGAHRHLADNWAKGEALGPETDALLRDYDPMVHLDRLFPTAILQYCGAKDEICPATAAQAFHDAAKPYYAMFPDLLRIVVNPETGHEIPGEAWEMTLEWLRKFV